VHFDPAQLLVLPVCVLSLVVHECAHGLAALACGDATPRERGRLTLNPIAHLSIVGTLLVPMVLLVFHVPILFGWARPMPVSWANLKHPRNDPVVVALAGPLSNFLLAVLFAGLASVAPPSGFLAPLRDLGIAGVQWNCALGLFNLIPIPPLDGAEAWKLPRLLRQWHRRRAAARPVNVRAAVERELAALDARDRQQPATTEAVDELLRKIAADGGTKKDPPPRG
jgi:Zn-dependent protease